MKAYMLEMYYMNYNIDKYEYQVHKVLLQGTNETIKDIVYSEIKDFNNINKKYNCSKVEQYNLYEFIGGESLKESESDE